LLMPLDIKIPPIIGAVNELVRTGKYVSEE
jgi:hypothetical protein